MSVHNLHRPLEKRIQIAAETAFEFGVAVGAVPPTMRAFFGGMLIGLAETYDGDDAEDLKRICATLRAGDPEAYEAIIKRAHTILGGLEGERNGVN